MKIFVGLFLILLGIVFFIDQTGMFSFLGISIWRMFDILWPIILILIGIKILDRRYSFFGVLVVLFGVVFLCSNAFNLNFFQIIWPVIIILVGFTILFKRPHHAHVSRDTINTVSTNDTLNEDISFKSIDNKIESKDFKGGRVDLAFGNYVLDLTNAKISADGAKISVECVFGKTTVLVPKNCRVVTNGSSVLGAWNPRLSPVNIEKPVLEISGTSVFGEVVISN